MLRFSVRFFFHNKKRTYQAIMTLTLALVIYLSTTLLVRGYSANVSGMAEIIQPSNLLLIVEEGKSLSQSIINNDTLTFLQEYSEYAPNVEVILPQLYIPVLIKGETDTEIVTHLRLLDLDKFEEFQSHHYTYDLSTLDNEELIIGQQLSYLTTSGVGSIVQIEIDNLYVNESFQLSLQNNYTIANIIESGHEYDIEVIGSLDDFLLNTTIDYYSFIELRIKDVREIDTVRADIENEFGNLEVLDEKQTQNFILYATEEVIKTLTLLQVLFFILMLVSIGYSIYTLVKESEKEIFTLRSIGATQGQITLLFMLQALFIGVTSAFLSLVVGYLAVTGIVGLVTATMQLPFIPLNIEIGLVGIIFLFSLSLSIISGIYPALTASKIKVIREEF